MWDNILESGGYNRAQHLFRTPYGADVFGYDPRCAHFQHPDTDTETAGPVDALSELQPVIQARAPRLNRGMNTMAPQANASEKTPMKMGQR